jgi:hypothetical protein
MHIMPPTFESSAQKVGRSNANLLVLVETLLKLTNTGTAGPINFRSIELHFRRRSGQKCGQIYARLAGMGALGDRGLLAGLFPQSRIPRLKPQS